MTRGRYVINAVECDYTGCMESFDGLPGQTWPQVLKHVESLGWVTIGGRGGFATHHCPKHQADEVGTEETER